MLKTTKKKLKLVVDTDDVTWYDIRVATETSGKQIKRIVKRVLAK